MHSNKLKNSKSKPSHNKIFKVESTFFKAKQPLLNSSYQDEVIDTKIGGFGGQNKAYQKKLYLSSPFLVTFSLKLQL
jgi:hypothetical protein